MENGNSGCLGLLIAVPIIAVYLIVLMHFYDPVEAIPPTPPPAPATTTVHIPHHHRT